MTVNTELAEHSLEELQKELLATRAELENKRFFDGNLSRFAAIMRWHSEMQIEDWGNQVVRELATFSDALQAALYLSDQKGEGKTYLRLIGRYACGEQTPESIDLGEGLVGQAAKSNTTFYLDSLNDSQEPDSFDTHSGAMVLSPTCLLIQPLVHNEHVEGILELASLKPLEPRVLEFMKLLSEPLGANLMSIRSQDRVKSLLVEAQQKAEMLLQKEEQMRLLNESLEIRVTERTSELESTLQNLQSTQNQLVQSEKMASLGQLIAGIAHEINTPIGAVKASAGNMQDVLPGMMRGLPDFLRSLNPDQEALFHRAMDQTLHSRRTLSSREERQLRKQLRQDMEEQGIDNADVIAQKLVEAGIIEGVDQLYPLLKSELQERFIDMLYQISQLNGNLENISIAADKTKRVVMALKSYVHTDSPDKPIDVDLRKNMDIILTLYHNQMKHGIDLVSDLEDDLIVHCIPDEVGQIWTNIIHNGMQAMNYQGVLEVKMYRENGYAVTTITDSGPGIPAEIQSKIFEPFFTTKSKGEGTGIGLDICRKIVEKYNGDLGLESEPGRTCFIVRLPLVNA